MSGHSRWAQIKHKKGATDKKRSTLFSKLSRNITIAARQGDDPGFNFKLRLAIDMARTANMPKDNIEKAIAKGASKDAQDAALEEVIYEGFGPAGSAFIIETITDNRNRTSSFMRSTFAKHGGNLGGNGAVQWMFEKKGRISIPKTEGNEMQAIESGAQDLKTEDDTLTVYTKPEELKAVEQKLKEKNITTKEASIDYVPKEYLSLTAEQEQKVRQLYEELEDNEDVNAIYTNTNI